MNKLLTVIATMLAPSACTNSEHKLEEERRARREAEFNRVQREQQREKERQQEEQQREQEEAQPEEPEAPAGPQYEDVEYYYFTSNTEKVPVKCLNRAGAEDGDGAYQGEACGERFYNCDNKNTYSCQTSVKYYTKTERKLVQ